MIEYLKPDWTAPANVRAFTTTRKGGFSQGRWSSLNLGGNSGDDPQHIEQNLRLLQTSLPSAPCWLNQVHGANVAKLNGHTSPETGADAATSNVAGQVCAILSADCLPVLFCDRSGTRVAAAHAGWRGLAAGVLEATVAAMGCHPGDLMAWLGPAIGPRAFEVGEDVFETFAGADSGNLAAFKRHGNRWLADLYQLARIKLAKTGLEQVTGGEQCTFTDNCRFFSYRRDGLTGRMASVIWLTV